MLVHWLVDQRANGVSLLLTHSPLLLFFSLLASNNLKGSIPSEIQHLRSLDSLNLRNNSLEGDIPEGLQNLLHLTHLDLSDNRLIGQISPLYWIGEKLTHMEVLNLSSNHLSLDGPNNSHSRRQPIGGESHLKTLALGGNVPNHDESGDSITILAFPEEIRYLTNLKELSLDRSNIGGRIPAWVFHELHELKFLDLSHNRLTGSISGEFPSVNGLFSSLQHLESLLLHDNPLTGTLPESVGWMSDLSEFSVCFKSVVVYVCFHCIE